MKTENLSADYADFADEVDESRKQKLKTLPQISRTKWMKTEN